MFLEDYKGMYKGDWDSIGAVVDVAVLSGVFNKNGTWYSGNLLNKSFQFGKLWNELYNDIDLEKKIVEAIGGRFKEIDFTYEPSERIIIKEEGLENVDAEVATK